MPTIDLGRKDECCSPCEPCAPDKKEPRIYYPTFSISTDSVAEIPEGDFEATVKLHTKGGEWSEDEKGKKKCTYRFEVMSITPGKPSKASKKKEEPDAATAILDSMKKSRASKVAKTEDEEY